MAEKTPRAVKFEVALLDAIDELMAPMDPRPSRAAMINHLLWRQVRLMQNVGWLAQRIYRIEHPDDGEWGSVSINDKELYYLRAKEFIEEAGRG